ncbi:MAG: hypothetical protein Kow00108_06940 [Calditrichia bacterium]
MKQSLGKKIIIGATVSFVLLLILNGCMMLGMAGHHGMRGTVSGNYSRVVGNVNTGDKIDKILNVLIKDLEQKHPPVSTIAIWEIRSRTAGIDVEMIRRNLITRLVESGQFKIVARDRLESILAEHNLSITGIIDNQSAVEIGKLVGVEGFIDGYVNVIDNHLIVSLNLIETKSGTIIWAKTMED